MTKFLIQLKLIKFHIENILENARKEIQDYIDFCLDVYGEDIKQIDQNDQDEMRYFLLATTDITGELDVELSITTISLKCSTIRKQI